MTREQALPYVSFCIDDALSERSIGLLGRVAAG